jgi:predicted glycosyltransferase involved in capsule biosynthesis
MQMTIQLSVIVPLYGFQKQREAALQSLLVAIDAQDARVVDAAGHPTEEKRFEVIIVEQKSPGKSGPVWHNFDEKPYLKHIVLPMQEKGFNKSWCMNVAAKKASCEILMFLDVDMVFDKTYFDKIMRHKSCKRYFTCWQYIVSMPGKDMPVAKIITKDILTAGGAFCVERGFFWDAGGMNENYFGYGGEDNDLWVRVNRLLGDRTKHNVDFLPYALGHHYHDWAEPSPDRFYPLNRTNQHTATVMAKLKAAPLGNPDGPTLIDLSDIVLAEAGLEEKHGKGLRE